MQGLVEEVSLDQASCFCRGVQLTAPVFGSVHVPRRLRLDGGGDKLLMMARGAPKARTNLEAASVIPDDGLEAIARSYSAAFPTASRDGFRAHLAVVRTGNQLGQAVSQFLSTRFGTNRARYSLMRALYFTSDHRLPQSEVAREMNVTSGNVTQLIDALEREGLVERVVSETDRRITYAQLTRGGAEKCDEMVPAMAQFMEESAAAALSRDEMNELTRLLNKFRHHLRGIVGAE